MKETGFANRRPMPVDSPTNGRPIGEVLRDIVGHIAEIVRAEMRLVTVELRQEAGEFKSAAISIAIGNVLLIYGGTFLLLGLVFALALVWPAWLAALAVGGAVALIGGIVVKAGIRKLKQR
jgi:uncharacterized membrane protein YqjE